MSQEDILKALEKADGGLSAEELAIITGVSAASVRRCLNCLLKTHEVIKIKLNKKQIEELERSFSGRHYKWKV